MRKARKHLAEVLRLAAQRISERILSVPGERVILGSDLARLYGVPTSRFNEAVERNHQRFPPDFRFHLTQEEWMAQALIFQSGISNQTHRDPSRTDTTGFE